MILEHSDAVYAAQKLTEYFKDFGRIDDYFRARKIERVKNIPNMVDWLIRMALIMQKNEHLKAIQKT